MHILLLTVEYTPELSGGVGTHAEELTAGLVGLGNHVTVLACAPRQAHAVTESNKAIHLIEPPVGGNLSKRSIVSDITAFNRALVTYACHQDIGGRPDIIQCCNWLTYSAAEELAQIFSVPIVCSMHYVSDPIERWWGQEPDAVIVERELKLLSSDREFITVSDSLGDILREHHGVPLERLHTVHNGIRLEAFRPSALHDGAIQDLRASVGPEDSLIVLFAGRIHPQKGISALLSSAEQVIANDPRVRYLIVGEPDSRDSAAQFRETLNARPLLKKGVKVLGKMRRNELALLYKIANIALIPSIYEACCYAALEAMASAVPVVATNVGGIPEIVEHGITGLLVPVHTQDSGLHRVDIEALTAATLLLLHDTNLAREMGASGEKRVKERFSVEAMASATQEVYKLSIERAHR